MRTVNLVIRTAKFRWGWPVAGVALLVLFACAWYQATRIPTALESRVVQQLRAAGYGDTEVAVAGRDVTVSGITTARGKATIAAIVQDTAGVRSVTDKLVVTATNTIDFHYIATSEAVTIRAVIPDHASVTSILSMMKRLHGSKFNNELKVDPQATKPAWLEAAVSAISTLYGQPSIELEIRGNRAVLRGNMRDNNAKISIVLAIQNRFSDYGVSLEDRTTVIAISESAHLTLTKLGDHVMLAGHMPSERYITKLNAVAQVVFPGLSVSDQLSAGEDKAEPEWLDAVISLMPELTYIHRAGIKTDGQTLTLAGEVQTEAEKQALLERAEYVLGDLMPIVDRLTVKAVPAQPAPATETASVQPSASATETTAPPIGGEEIPPPLVPSAPTSIVKPPPAAVSLSSKLAQLDFTAIRFQSGSARLARSGHAVLGEVTELLREHGTRGIEISGHTDSTGRESYNMKLSQQRAKTVLNYLVTQGVEPKRMTSVGYGESRPVASNETAAGQARNRRIEITVKREGE
ncbi:MAG: OmpA family protein [Gammaproteobacteria bacterium]|nr:OmpA family protein [Gammaproteobacteria bacterium]